MEIRRFAGLTAEWPLSTNGMPFMPTETQWHFETHLSLPHLPRTFPVPPLTLMDVHVRVWNWLGCPNLFLPGTRGVMAASWGIKPLSMTSLFLGLPSWKNLNESKGLDLRHPCHCNPYWQG